MQVAEGVWVPKSHYGMQGEPGMALRDFFAAKALTGIAQVWEHWTDKDRAEHAYAQADAMLAARKPVEDGGPGDVRAANTCILAVLNLLDRPEPAVEHALRILKRDAERILPDRKVEVPHE